MRNSKPTRPSSNVDVLCVERCKRKSLGHRMSPYGSKSRRLDAEFAKRLLLRLLLRDRSGRRWYAVGRCSARTVALRLCAIRLWLINLIVVVFVNIDVASGWLVVFGSRSLLCRRWCLRHARQRCLRLRGSNGCQRGRVVGSL
jgi:hypothetical protein